MKLNILGCYSATPRTFTNPTSQVLEIKNHLFLIDCGEGTQVQLRKHKIKFNRIKHIFISHLHGDHFFGLVGLISTFRLLGREADLHIHAPKGLKEVIVLQMKLAQSWTNYNLYFHELTSTSSELIFEDEKVEVHTIPLDHRIYTNGFLFKEKMGERKLD
ncbi:MAG: MBL fold metallo-hydrolase, partial [Mesoflavibacter sp.]|nr:MBL fold metallo-hydrolase [Mesoflavibacter sp.]